MIASLIADSTRVRARSASHRDTGENLPVHFVRESPRAAREQQITSSNITNRLRSRRVGVLLSQWDKKLSLQVAIPRLCTASYDVRKNIYIEKCIYRDVIHMRCDGAGVCSRSPATCVLYFVDPTRCALHVSNGHLSSEGAWNERFA